MDKRSSWGHWLMSTCLRVPSEKFQQYQRDTFTMDSEGTRINCTPPPHQPPIMLPPAQRQATYQPQPQLRQQDFVSMSYPDTQPLSQTQGWIPQAPQAQQVIFAVCCIVCIICNFHF